MCGIVGYIGPKNIAEVLLKGLSRLEYRGYDSAGIATLEDGVISVLKESGKLEVLKKKAGQVPFEGSLGIGHTRWATHGEPSQRNAHPHSDCTGKVAIVHNGIIENHDALRRELEAKGHTFDSETDSEVLSHLIEDFHVEQGLTLAEAVSRALKVIEGSYAFCAMSQNEGNTLIAARNGSPLVVGLGKNENFVASDAPAVLEHTRDVIFLDDYQMAVISNERVEIFSKTGAPVEKKVSRLDWDLNDVSKNGFDHYMLKEIEEQPEVIERILKTKLPNGVLSKEFFDVLRVDEDEIISAERITIQACGTSWHAALAGKFLFEAIAGIPTDVEVSSEYRYRPLVKQPGTLLLSITQSGETIDTLMGLRRGRDLGYTTVSIANVLGSTITRESDAVLYTQAGPEIGVASTKAYTAQLTVLFLLALYWAGLKGTLKVCELESLTKDLANIPSQMRSIIAGKEKIRQVASAYQQSRDFLFLGRGIHCPSAYEGALKIKEIAYIHATGHAAGEMKHGPIALIDAKVPVVAIAPKSAILEKMVSNVREVKAREGKVIAITNAFCGELIAASDSVIEVPETNDWLAPLLTALPLQYLAYFVAVMRGTDVDQPRNLAKSVTVE